MREEWVLTPELHDLLYQKFMREKSHEARAILAEWRHELMHDPELDEACEASLQQGTPEYWAIKNAFTRLGLDLESEDE